MKNITTANLQIYLALAIKIMEGTSPPPEKGEKNSEGNKATDFFYLYAMLYFFLLLL